MTVETLHPARAAEASTSPGGSITDAIYQALISGITVLMVLELVIIFLKVLAPLIKSSPVLVGSETIVDETLTSAITRLLVFVAPFAAYAACARKVRSLEITDLKRAIGILLAATGLVYALASMGQWVFQVGPFAESPDFGFTLSGAENGAIITEIDADGAAAEAGLETDDIILGIRREELSFGELQERLKEFKIEDTVRLNILRGGEEEQMPLTVGAGVKVTLRGIVFRLIIALLIAVIVAFFWPGYATPYVVLTITLLPLFLGYLWLFNSTFSRHTKGIFPVGVEGEFGGLELGNWKFLTDDDVSVFSIVLAVLLIAFVTTAVVLFLLNRLGRVNLQSRRVLLRVSSLVFGIVSLFLVIVCFLQNGSNWKLIRDHFGLTLNNWKFLTDEANFFTITRDAFLMAVAVATVVLAVSWLVNYALLRMSYRGGAGFQSRAAMLRVFVIMTLLLAVVFIMENSDELPANSIMRATIKTLQIAVSMTVIVLIVSSMAGYALSRMNFAGRRTFLSLTLILHGFPAVTLLLAIFFVLQNISKIPVIGNIFGYNTNGGIALVLVAFEMPLGVWLMKGFFDGISWDMERSALIDGASRWRTFWEILLPQIRPGLLALGIFAFITGWGAYLIPATYSISAKSSTLAVYINQLTDETSPTNWGEVAAVGLFQMIPVIIFFIFAQEYLLNIYAGGSKGSS